MKVVNVKEELADPGYARYLLDGAISECKAEGSKVIVVIHGYGSHGQGALLRKVFANY